MEARVGTVQQFPAGGTAVHDDTLYPGHAPPRGAEFFDDSRALQLPEKTQVRISRWIFDNNERGEVPMLDQAGIERLGNLPPLRTEQRVERLRFNRHRIAAGVNPTHDRIDDEQTALFQAATECRDMTDLDWLPREVNALGLLREVSLGIKTFVPTARGVERLEAIAQPSS